MLISKSHKFIFIHIYKNAGTSITNALSSYAEPNRRLFGSEKLAMIEDKYLNKKLLHPHAKATEIITKLGSDVFDEYFKFAIVRNPWDWQVSLYSYMLKNKKHYQHDLIKELGSFEKYIQWRCANEVEFQKDFVFSGDGKLLVDFIGRYENLEKDFDRICEHLGIHAVLPMMNVSNKRTYKEYYNRRSVDLVREVFDPDIQAFEYGY